MQSESYKGGKIVLVGHQTIFKYMTGTEWEMIQDNNDSNNDPIMSTLSAGRKMKGEI